MIESNEAVPSILIHCLASNGTIFVCQKVPQIEKPPSSAASAALGDKESQVYSSMTMQAMRLDSLVGSEESCLLLIILQGMGEHDVYCIDSLMATDIDKKLEHIEAMAYSSWLTTLWQRF